MISLSRWPTETIEVTGHIVDSLLLAKILDTILEAGCDYEIADVSIGKTSLDPSSARIAVTGDDDVLGPLLDELQVHGANRTAQEDARARGGRPRRRAARRLLLDHQPRRRGAGGRRVAAGRQPRDGLRPRRRATATPRRCRCTASAPATRWWWAARACGSGARRRPGTPRCSSSWRPRSPPRSPRRCWSPGWPIGCGPRATGAGGCWSWRGRRSSTPAGPPTWPASSRPGWVDVLFAGNGFATHDIESNVLGTSLGVSVAEGTPTEGGHANHLRVINEVRRHGSIAAAVEAGFVTGGVMRACVERGVPFVLGGSIRDDGPLPDVITDTVAAADAMRAAPRRACRWR